MTRNVGDRHTHYARLPRIVGRLAVAAVFVTIWFLLAGRVAWPEAWALLTLFLIFVVTLTWRLAHTDPALLRERSQPPDKAEPWDRRVMRVYAGLLFIVMVVVALDSGRFRWSVVPPWVQAFGWVLIVACGAVVWHVSTTNAYLSRYARIQDDRGHTVVRHGLYASVRHPMYLGIILLFCGLPVALGSWYAYPPSMAIVCLFVYRTSREDRMLHEGLTGYADYAQDVRYRLVPGIW